MVNINDIYRCEICGNIIESVHGGHESLVCCGQAMTKMEPKSGPEGQEKHLPIIEKTGNKVVVKVGSIPHPMIEEHFIEWIEIIIGNKVQRAFLKPGDEPTAEFQVADINESIMARAYCNIHGLWATNL